MSAETKESPVPDQDDPTPDLSTDTHVTPDQETKGPWVVLPVAGGVEQGKVAGEVEHQKVAGEVEHQKVAGEVEQQQKVVGEIEQQKVLGEIEQQNVESEVEQQKVVDEVEQEKVAGEVEQQQKVVGEIEQQKVLDEIEQQNVESEVEQQKVAGEVEQQQKVEGEIELQKVEGEVEQQKVAGEVEQQKVVDEVEQQKVAGEVEQQKVVDEVEQQKVAGEVEQQKVAGEVEQQKVAGELEQQTVAGELEVQKAAAGDAAAAGTKARPVQQATKRERKVVEYGGFRFFEFERVSVSTEQHLRDLKAMPLRADDVLIAAFPKCGTHWVWEVVHMLTSGRAEYETRTKEHLMLEFHDVDKFRAMPSPRILNTHLFLSVLSEEMATQGTKVVHVMRNPKDVAVSQYFHRRQRDDFDDKGILPFVESFLDGGDLPGGCFSDYLAYLQEMQRWQAQNPEVPVINLYFEDIKRAPVECTQRLAAFLGLPGTEEFCRQVADACSFHNLKAADMSKKYPTWSHQASGTEEAAAKGLDELPAPLQGESTINLSPKSKPKKIDFYRKGEIGDWKNYLTVALSEKFDTVIEQNWKECDFAKRFVYEM